MDQKKTDKQQAKEFASSLLNDLRLSCQQSWRARLRAPIRKDRLEKYWQAPEGHLFSAPPMLRNFRCVKRLGLFPFILASPFLVFASESAESKRVDSLPAYVVVATRTPLGLERVSPSVDYVSGESLQRWQDRELSDTLSRVSGIALSSNGASGNVASMFVRGSNSDQTAIFLDGRRLNPTFSGQYDLESLSVSNLESVQILKGGASVNFGSSGIGGVIDLRSQNPLKAGASGQSKFEMGSNGYRLIGIESSYADDIFSMSIGASILDTENERPNDAYEKLAILPRFDVKLSEFVSAELVAKYILAEKELPGTIVFPSPNDYLNTESWLLSPGIRYATDLLTIHLFYSRTLYVGEGVQSGPVYNEITGDEVNLQLDYSAADSLLLSTGAVYRKDQVYRRGLYQNNLEQAGIFAQAIWLVDESFELRGGVRHDGFSDYESAMTASLEAIYTLQDYNLSFFVKLASAYAPPSGQDLAYDSDPSTALEPDESESYEFGLRQSFFDGKLLYTVSLFRNEIEKLIDYDPFSFDAFNVNSATTEGLELSLDFLLVKDLEVSFGYTYLTAVSDVLDDPRTAYVFGSPDSAKDVRLVRRPRHLLQISANYQLSEDIRVGAQAVGNFDRQDFDPVTFIQSEAEDYFVVSLVTDWQINEDWSVFARVENLLDESYAPAAGFTALGRSGYIGASFEF